MIRKKRARKKRSQGRMKGYEIRRRVTRGTKYVGITSDPERRKAQHKRDGKKGKFKVVKKKRRGMSEAKARDWEQTRLSRHRARNLGRNPKYNKTRHG